MHQIDAPQTPIDWRCERPTPHFPNSTSPRHQCLRHNVFTCHAHIFANPVNLFLAMPQQYDQRKRSINYVNLCKVDAGRMLDEIRSVSVKCSARQINDDKMQTAPRNNRQTLDGARACVWPAHRTLTDTSTLTCRVARKTVSHQNSQFYNFIKY